MAPGRWRPEPPPRPVPYRRPPPRPPGTTPYVCHDGTRWTRPPTVFRPLDVEAYTQAVRAGRDLAAVWRTARSLGDRTGSAKPLLSTAELRRDGRVLLALFVDALNREWSGRTPEGGVCGVPPHRLLFAPPPPGAEGGMWGRALPRRWLVPDDRLDAATRRVIEALGRLRQRRRGGDHAAEDAALRLAEAPLVPCNALLQAVMALFRGHAAVAGAGAAVPAPAGSRLVGVFLLQRISGSIAPGVPASRCALVCRTPQNEPQFHHARFWALRWIGGDEYLRQHPVV